MFLPDCRLRVDFDQVDKTRHPYDDYNTEKQVEIKSTWKNVHAAEEAPQIQLCTRALRIL